MAELRALINQIRFSLDNLGAQNRHHDFETICRHFSRRRLGLNIIPATGPVASGGDQGRDFETYEVLPEMRGVLGGGKLVEGSAAFACTIQKDDLPSKVKSDVKQIVEQGSRVDIVYYFSLQNIEVSKRHKLQKWTQKKYNTRLEIIDGEALADDLAERDLFWIALEYLQIPASLYPAIDDIDYLKTKEKWEHLKVSGPNYALFDELRNLGRRCLFDEDTKSDLLFWLKKLEEFLNFEAPSEFKRKVLYELVALRLRGTGSLAGWEHYVRQYFEISPTFNHQVEAQEACVVVTYAMGSRFRGASDFDAAELKKWRETIEQYTNTELKKDYPKTIQAVIYELKGYLLLTSTNERNVDEGLDWWLKLASLIAETPLFPLERFSDVLIGMIDYIGQNPKYEELTEKIDSLLAQRVGDFIVAEKCRDRAIAYRNKGDLIKALKEFHKVKASWYAHETLYGSLLSMLIIAETYFDLGLVYAAKCYAAATVFIASRAREENIKVFIPRGLCALAEYEYASGEWAHFLEHTELALRALGAFSAGLDDPTSKKMYEKSMFYTSLVYVFTELLDKENLFKYVDKIVKSWGVNLLDDLIPLARESSSKKSTEYFLEKIKTEFKNYPFNDVGRERNASFNALGISWKFYWRNGLFQNAKAEQLISVLQILFAESIEEELYLLKGEAEIYITFGTDYDVQNKSTLDGFRWDVVLPEKMPSDKAEIEKYHLKTLGIAIKIFSELSLLPQARIHKLLETLFKEGLMSKIVAGNTYEVLFVDIVPRELYEEIISLLKITYLESLCFENATHRLLGWKDSVIPEYTKERSQELIQNRYKNSLVPISLTLQRLNKDPSFKENVRKLRLDKWKDWHILMAIASVAVNYRVKKIGFKSFEEMQRLFSKQMSLVESSESIAVPLIEFGETELRNHLMMTMPSTLKIMGLELNSPILTKLAIQEFLDRRCHYFDDDVQHKDIFQLD